MAKYRLKFKKFGETKFVSHLDLVRLFTRLHTRAHIPLSYSQGFNPHPKMSIALPLSVGIESEGEYIDVSYDSSPSCEEVVTRLNEKAPIGIEIVRAQMLFEGAKKLSDISMAKYIINFEGCGLCQEKLDAFMARETIEIEKKTKRSVGMVDIKNDILDVKLLSSYPDGAIVEATLSAGSVSNLKADLFVSAMEMYIDDFNVDYYSITRTEILDSKGAPFI